MNKEIGSFYERITPESSNEEFKNTILRKAEKMNTEKKKISFKKPMLAIGAAAAAATVGITAGAATGLFNFDGIFGNVITAESEADADLLVSEALDFSFVTSDEDYIIIPRGVTGTECSFIASFEVARADGKPVSDYLLYQPTESRLWSTHHFGAVIPVEERVEYGAAMDEMSFTINDEGNIDVVVGMTYSTDIVGRTIRMNFADLYEYNKVLLFTEENDLFADFATEDDRFMPFYDMESGAVYDADFFRPNLEEIADIDTSDIVLHELDWQVEFVYEPSENAVYSLTGTDLSQSFTETVVILYDVYEIPCTMEDIEISSINTMITYRLAEEYSEIGTQMEQEIFLITKDGEQIKTQFEFGSSRELPDGGYGFLLTAKNVDDNGNRIAVDLSEITALSVNGTVYPLG